MKKLFSLLLLCGALCTLASCEKDNDHPEPETNRFVLSGKNYSNFTVSVTKDELNKGNWHLCPSGRRQHDGVVAGMFHATRRGESGPYEGRPSTGS